MPEPTIHTLEALLDASLPESMASLRAQTEWGWQDDDQGRAFLALESLRAWLLDDAGDAVPRAWAAIESLVATRDGVLLNALAVGLLEGHWPKRHVALMGARTRALLGELVMRAEGLEPPHLSAPAPKAGVSANSTTPARPVHRTSRPGGRERSEDHRGAVVEVVLAEAQHDVARGAQRGVAESGRRPASAAASCGGPSISTQTTGRAASTEVDLEAVDVDVGPRGRHPGAPAPAGRKPPLEPAARPGAAAPDAVRAPR